MPSTKNLGAMVVKLEADSAQMRRELRLIEGRVNKSSQSMERSFASVSTSWKSALHMPMPVRRWLGRWPRHRNPHRNHAPLA